MMVDELRSLVGKAMEVAVCEGRHVFKGVLYAIDPEGNGFVLVQFDSRNQPTTAVLVRPQAVSSVTVIAEGESAPIDLHRWIVEARSEAHTTPLSLNELTTLLTKHHLPFTVVESAVHVLGCEITPPYSARTCHGPNPMILRRLATILPGTL